MRDLAAALTVVCAIGAITPAVARAAAGARETRLWIVQPPGELVEFSTGDFAPIRRVRLPEFAFAEPAGITVNHRGEILAPTNDDSLWVWDGTRWRTPSRPPNGRYLVPIDSKRGTCNRRWFLGAGGNSLFMLETSTVTWTGENGWTGSGDEADSAYNAARMEETDFELRPRAVVFDIPYARCEDNPSTLEVDVQPCTEAWVFAPARVVDDFFALFRKVGWPALSKRAGTVPYGDLHRTLFVRDRGGWRPDTLQESWDTFADRGRTRIVSDPDSGCCGNSNATCDKSRIVRDGVVTEFFNEWTRFDNRHFDMSFFAENIMPSPDRRSVGFTVRGDGTLREWVPRGIYEDWVEGHVDTLGLRRVESAVAELPAAEVTVLDPRPETRLRLPHAEFVGWLDRNHALILEQGAIAMIDVRTGQRRDSGIRVRSVADVIVVGP